MFGFNILVLFGLLLIAWLIFSQMRTQRLKISRMWIAPAFMILLSYPSLTRLPLHKFLNILVLLLAGGLGVGLSISREVFKKITVDKAAREIYIKGTPIGLLLWLGAIIFERYVKDFLQTSRGILTPEIIAPALMVFSLSAVIARRVYLYFKYVKAES
jgi:hypothetical protein